MERLVDESEAEGEPRLSKCVVWTTLPVLSQICPALGHVGICDSNGVVYDFQGTGHVGRGKMLFADPKEKWELDIDAEVLDNALAETANEFRNQTYDMCCSNCHFFVAKVLENAGYQQPCCFCGKWSTCATAKVAVQLVIHGRYLGCCPFLSTYIPFLIVYGIIVLICVLILKI